MKKFAFALDKVLDYKGQVENSLRSEYAQKMAKVKKQEVYIDSLISQFAGCRNEFEARKKQGCTVNLMVSYDGYLNSLRKQIEKEKQEIVLIDNHDFIATDEIYNGKQRPDTYSSK